MSIQGLTPQKLIKARDGRATFIVSFLRCASTYPDETIWVFEGKDIKYYGPKIEIILGYRPRAIISAGGKKNVLAVLEFAETNEDFKSRKYACLIDKDFDTSHPVSKNLYVTPTYSVENLYTTEACLGKVLQGQFDLNDHNSEGQIKNICARYNSWINRFLALLRDLNAWIKLQKGMPGYKLKLNEVGIEKLFDISWNVRRLSIKKKYKLDSLTKVYPDAAVIDTADVQAEIAANFSSRLHEVSRGKYLTEFLYIVLTKLIHDAKQKRPLFFKKKKSVTFSLSKVNILSDLSAYSDTPNCLKQFIAQYA